MRSNGKFCTSGIQKWFHVKVWTVYVCTFHGSRGRTINVIQKMSSTMMIHVTYKKLRKIMSNYFKTFFLVWWFISTRILFYVSNFTFLFEKHGVRSRMKNRAYHQYFRQSIFQHFHLHFAINTLFRKVVWIEAKYYGDREKKLGQL